MEIILQIKPVYLKKNNPPKYEMNVKTEVDKEQNQGESDNDTIRKSLVGFAWGVLASFLIAAGTVCVQVCLFFLAIITCTNSVEALIL